MKKVFSVVVLGVLLLASASAQAVTAKRDNYVVFNVKGDCGQEDCIAILKDALKEDAKDIVSVDATALAPHQRIDYKTIIIAFKNYKTAPYSDVMQKIAASGYEIISYVIHDTHTGQDVIIPH